MLGVFIYSCLNTGVATFQGSRLVGAHCNSFVAIQAVLSNHTIVVFEVALSIRRLVRTYSQAFHPLEWDLIYDIMGVVQRHLNLLKVRTGENPALPSSNLGQCLRDLFVAVEELYAGGSGLSIGEPERFFALVEENMDTMPVRGWRGGRRRLRVGKSVGGGMMRNC